MNFRTATDRMRATNVRQLDVARALRVSNNLVKRARCVQNSPHHRSAPKEWPEALAGLARDRAARLVALADELEATNT